MTRGPGALISGHRIMACAPPTRLQSSRRTGPSCIGRSRRPRASRSKSLSSNAFRPCPSPTRVDEIFFDSGLAGIGIGHELTHVRLQGLQVVQASCERSFPELWHHDSFEIRLLKVGFKHSGSAAGKQSLGVSLHASRGKLMTVVARQEGPARSEPSSIRAARGKTFKDRLSHSTATK